MITQARAKINLSLDITGKRQDGYHELDTLFWQLRLCDVIDIRPSSGKEIKVTCSDKSLSCGRDNLAFAAAEMMFDEFDIKGGIDIHIEKNIPMGAGLGGGSSDAAAVLKAVNKLYEIGLDNAKLKEIAVRLGADVPFFIEGGFAQAKGIGEKLSVLPKAELPPMLIVKPDVHISTPWAYKTVDEFGEIYHPDIEAMKIAVKEKKFEKICALAGNSFEKPVFSKLPIVYNIKKEMLTLGAGGCVMTGSGSALFALFRNEEDALKAKEILETQDNSLRLFFEAGGYNGEETQGF